VATEYKGQYPWGAVHFTYTYSEETKCQCLNCRKVNGTSPPLFGIPKNAFAITKGEEELKHYDITPNFQRFFCQTCGTGMVYDGYKAPNKRASFVGTFPNNYDALRVQFPKNVPDFFQVTKQTDEL